MSHPLIGEVEVAMSQEDGSYRLQYVRWLKDARSVLNTVIADSIPEGLRLLADEMERAGRAEFRR